MSRRLAEPDERQAPRTGKPGRDVRRAEPRAGFPPDEREGVRHAPVGDRTRPHRFPEHHPQRPETEPPRRRPRPALRRRLEQHFRREHPGAPEIRVDRRKTGLAPVAHAFVVVHAENREIVRNGDAFEPGRFQDVFADDVVRGEHAARLGQSDQEPAQLRMPPDRRRFAVLDFRRRLGVEGRDAAAVFADGVAEHALARPAPVVRLRRRHERELGKPRAEQRARGDARGRFGIVAHGKRLGGALPGRRTEKDDGKGAERRVVRQRRPLRAFHDRAHRVPERREFGHEPHRRVLRHHLHVRSPPGGDFDDAGEYARIVGLGRGLKVEDRVHALRRASKDSGFSLRRQAETSAGV